MDQRDDRYSPVANELTDFATDALDYVPETNPREPKDAAWLRWLKFASIIVFPALVFGLGFLFEDYFVQTSGDTHYQRQRASSRVEHDSIGFMKVRFALGAAIGGALGLVYVVRCIVKKADP
jgi:hypothetical protein